MLFVDDHNHDVDGEFHRTAWEEIARAVGPLRDLPNDHELYRSFFVFPDGPPTTSHELNGWGDNLVHKHLQAVVHEGASPSSTAARTTRPSGTTIRTTSASSPWTTHASA